jgi:hypothetical protein
MRKPSVAQVLIVTGVAAVLWAAVLLVIANLRFGGDLRGFLFLGTSFRHPVTLADAPSYGAQGYDGQFYAALATDPLLRHDETVLALDSPRYRAVHLTVPVVSWLLGAMQPAAAVRLYQALCWLLALAAIYLAADWLREHGRSPWWALLLVPNAGVATSIMRCTQDGAALAFVLAALWARRRERRALTIALLVAATLTRETMILAACAVAFSEYSAGRTRQAVRLVAVPGAALVGVMLWRLVTVPTGPLLGGSFAAPFQWVLLKFDQMLAANIKITSIELWGFLALIAALAALAAFGRTESAFTAEELIFLAFMVVSWTFSFAVYVDVYGYMRALMPLPFFALLIGATRTDLAKRALLLLVPAAFAFVGVLMVRAEVKAAMNVFHG